MRYSESHKEETRKRVLKAAASAVRAKGPDGVGVAEIMAEVGLTHGGFYAHFPNKEALVAAAIGEAFDQSRRRFGRLTDGMNAEQALSAFVDAYVSAEHRNNPQRGCPIATLSSDLPRQGPAVRMAFDAGVTSLIARLAGWLPEMDARERVGMATSLLAEMAGAVSLSRAISDDALAERLLEDSRDRIKARMGLPETQEPPQ
jgi:TetR/AcrR family transcriptional repressor of nem operon